MKFCPIDWYKEMTTDDSNRVSMQKTTYFWGFIAMTGWISKLVVMGMSPTEAVAVFTVYGGLFVLGTLGSKGIDAIQGKGNAQNSGDSI